MSDRLFDVNLKFLENCNYNESSVDKEIALPLQSPTMHVTYKNINTPGRSSTLIYYNDKIELNANVTYQVENEMMSVPGNVIFYYINNDDPTQTRHQINTDPISVDYEGNAKAIFMPHKSCAIIAEYDGQPYYGIVTNENNPTYIELNKIPTKVVFDNFPPYFVKPEEDIQLGVTVTNELDNQIIDYGIVTFLHYDTFNNGEEKVIGNPTYLINGKSYIHYSPEQLEDTQSSYNIELIRAAYNYNNNLYGVDWKYYDMSDDYTSIAILRANTLNINIQKREGNNYINLSANEDGLLLAYNTDMICLCFTITDENNNEIVFKNTDTITVHIHNYDTGEQRTLSAQYNTNEGNFICILNNLSFGTYVTYGTVIDANGEYVQFYDGQKITTSNTGSDINDDDLFLNSAESSRIYFKIEPEESNYNITLTATNNNVILNTTKVLNKNVLKAIITDNNNNYSSNDALLLAGKTCYFYSPTTRQTYKGTIKNQNNQLYGQLNQNITLNDVNDYIFYAYLPTATYTVQNGNNTLTKTYKQKYSNDIIIKARYKPQLLLTISSINDTYPGKIKYALICNGIYNVETINVDLLLNNQTYESFVFTEKQNQATGYIDNIEPGSNIIKAHIITSIYNSVYSDQHNVEITKGSLSPSVNQYSQSLITTRNTNILFGLQEVHNLNIDLNKIDTSKFNIQLTKDEYTQNITNLIFEQANSQYISIKGNINLCDDGIWTVNFAYNDDNNIYYNSCNNTFNINAIRYSPNFEYQQNVNKDTICKIISADTNTHNNEYVLIKTTFINEDEEEIKIINICDNNGNFTIQRPTQITSPAEWATYDNFSIEINPHDNLMSVFKASNTSNVITKFKNHFNDYDIQCTDNEIRYLYEQFINNSSLSLFVGYEQATVRYSQSLINTIIE